MNSLVKWFFIWFVLVVFSVAIFSVFGPQTKKIDSSIIEFGTTASSELYFKNIRSYFYRKEIDSASRFHIYRLKKFEQLEEDFSLVIVHNWLISESYIMVENENEVLKQELQLIFRDGVKEKELRLNANDVIAEYVFAADLLEFLTSEGELFFAYNDEKLNPQFKKALKTTLKDYFKLVGKLR